jgi:nucleotide-binding universal stress UspA family protein
MGRFIGIDEDGIMQIPKIVLPVDFSDRSIGAAQHAKALACRFHSEVHVVNVVDLRVWGMYGFTNDEPAADRFAPECKRFAQEQIEGYLDDELSGLKVKRVLLYGDPAREIVKYADSEQASLIVLPTHGLGPFRRFLLGSVTTKVLHDVHCPVWTGVHMEGPQKPMGFARILCALDPWSGDFSALSWAWQFGHPIGAQVRIVHALPGIYKSESIYFDDDIRRSMVALAEEQIRQAQERTGSKAEVEIVIGDAPAEVSRFAEAWNADLLVISRGVASAPLGRLRSRSYSFIRESPCPVVSV